MFNKSMAGAICLLFGIAGSAQATTIIAPGFIDNPVAALQNSNASFGDAVYDNAGNAYVISRTITGSSVFKIAPGGPGGTTTEFISTASRDATGLAINGNDLFVSFNNGLIQKADITAGVPTLSTVTTLGGLSSLNDIGIAPANSPFAGDLIFGGIGGARIGRLDLNTLVPTAIGSTAQSVSALTFDPLGDLVYIGGGTVREFAGGSETTIGTGISGGEAIAIHPGTGQIFVGQSSLNTLSILAGGLLSTFATSIDFDTGFFQDPLTFTPDGAGLLYAEGEAHSAVFLISGFPSVGVPEPITLLLLGLGLAGIGSARKRSH